MLISLWEGEKLTLVKEKRTCRRNGRTMVMEKGGELRRSIIDE